MELNLRKIQQLDVHQILEILLPTINNLYKTFDYIGITKEEFYDLALREVDKSKRTYKGDIAYIEYIKNRINIVIVDQVKNKLLEPKSAIIIINNYINKHLKKSDVYEDSIKNLKKLDKFFETYDYIPNPDVLLQIIEENSAFYRMIESIIKKHQTQIISGNLEKIFDDGTITLIIETFCMLNGIEIKESEEFEKDNIDLGNSELTDSVKIYLREIGKIPLLSLEEERKLAQRISQGDSYAKEIFIESNLKLVVSIARIYIGRGLSFLDLIQEGNLGLMTAVDKYDVNRGLKFSNYATHWIRQAITRAIADKGRNVRIPVYMYEKIGAYKKAITNLEVRLNRQPTINEIANEMGLSISEVTKLHKLQSDTVSMNTLISDDEDTELENFIPVSEETPEDVAIVGTMQFQVRKLLENCNLKPMEIEVLILRFGFNDNEPMTLEEVGKKFNITRERVRQIESKAFMKIRISKHIKALAEYMQNPDKSLENIEIFREKYRETGNSNKTFLKEDGLTKRKEKEEMSKLQTIYQYFKDYTKEQVDAMLEKLTEEEKELITARYGEDLNNPTPGKLSKEQTNKFYRSLVPMMRRLLSNPNKERKSRKKEKRTPKMEQKQSIMESVNGISTGMTKEKLVESPKNSTSDIEINKNKEPQSEYIHVDSTISRDSETQDGSKNITKEDCEKVLELLRTPTFNQMMSVLTVKESVIISLKLGYIDGKYFSADSIAQFLGIEAQEVIDTTRKVLLLYKDNINQFIDDAIEMVTEQPKQLTKKLQ